MPGNEPVYQKWREKRLAAVSLRRQDHIIKIPSLGRVTDNQIREILDQCEQFNMAIYEENEPEIEKNLKAQAKIRSSLLEFCKALGLAKSESHRSQGEDGVVAIKVHHDGVKNPADASTKGGYIPYSEKALSWHTDGYYNAPIHRIKAVILHCVRDAVVGGENEFFDHEIAYIRLRDADLNNIEALLNKDAMTIPENNDPRSTYRPPSVGPVFFLDEESGKLNMRYSARKRNIIWRDDKNTQMARAMLDDILSNDPQIMHHKLKPGQGIVSNNILHNRTGFGVKAGKNENSAKVSNRLIYRIRYLDRIGHGVK